MLAVGLDLASCLLELFKFFFVLVMRKLVMITLLVVNFDFANVVDNLFNAV